MSDIAAAAVATAAVEAGEGGSDRAQFGHKHVSALAIAAAVAADPRAAPSSEGVYRVL